MNVHQKYLNQHTQKMKSENGVSTHFLEQTHMSGTIVRCELELGLEMLFYDYYVKEDQSISDFGKSRLIEIFYCLSGYIEMTYGSDVVCLKENTIGIYDFNTCPKKVVAKKGHFKGIGLMMDADLADRGIGKFLSRKLITVQQFRENLEKQEELFLAFGDHHLRSVFLSIAENPYGYDKEYLLIKAMELVLIGNNSLKRLGADRRVRTSDYQCFERATTYMAYHLSSAITIQSLAEEMGITVRRLNQCFMAYASQTAFSYLKELRLLRGRHLLLQSDMTVTEIAGEVGWENPSKFSSAFKLRYEVSPLTYRKFYKID